jgi:putative spermidine/putrescine transport system ATP-binding protein
MRPNGALLLTGVSKRFGEVEAVADVDLAVDPGQFVCLLGPSGCGKTTTLRLIAGFELPDSGAVSLGGEDITVKPAHRRNIGMVFQAYALFPHLTVLDNVAFGLQMRRVPRREVGERVRRALATVRLEGFEHRYPKQLSGGQQQRVALARAIVIEPRLLLLDEPLSNLDARLRAEMRVELKMIQREVGITTVFVTHDQEEALALADVIVVMNQGRVVQTGTPVEIYESPASSFVASFLGQENFFTGKVVESGAGRLRVRLDEGVTVRAAANESFRRDERVLLVLRKERLVIGSGPPGGENELEARIGFVTYLGSTVQYLCSVGEGKTVLVTVQNDADAPSVRAGEQVRLGFRPEDCLCLRAT